MKAYRKKQPALNQSLFSGGLPLRQALNLAILAALYPAFSYANPNGAQIVSGQVSIDTATPGVTTITNSPNAIINWQNFSIAQNELTQFIQQNGQSAVLNRIIGQNPSEILGQLTSNGKVFLINPNGIVFGAGSTIDTQGLVASSLNLSNQDFLSGNYHLMAGSSAGNILNEGIIRAGKDGNIILIAPQIQNNGIIKSDGGSITLAAGQELTITNLDDPDIRFQIQAPADNVLNLGKLLTEGGAINVFASTIKHSGEINADSVQIDKQGNIQLVAQQDITLTSGSKISANNSQGDAGTIHIDSKAGTTLAQGTIEAQATHTGKGGSIELLGERVGVLDQAQIDASGENGGGQVLVGGDYQGKNPNIHNATATYIGKDTTIKADTKTNGNGGKAIVWSDDTTRVHGNISAKGGANGGNGGFVETSGHNYLDVAGARVDTRAPNGTTGNWLLDPTDITITHGTTTAATFTGNIFNNGAGASSSLTDGDINTALNTSSVTIQTTSAYTGVLGDITFDSTGGAILISETNAVPVTLTLNADNNIVFTGANGTLFRAANSTGQLDIMFFVPNGKVRTDVGSSVTLDGSSSGPYGLARAWLSDGRAWDNHGTLNITDKASVHLGITSSFNNKSGGIANIAGTTGWAFWSDANDDGVINNEGTFNVTKSTAFEAAYNQVASGLLNVKDVNLNLQNAKSISGTVNLTPAGATTFATLNVNESHGAAASFINTNILGAGPIGSKLTIGGNVGGTPTASFSGIYAPDVLLSIGGANPGNVSIVGDSLFKTVAYTSGTFALNNAVLSINDGDFTIPTVTTHTGNVGYRVRGNLTVSSAFALPGNLDLVAGWNGSGYAVNPGANANIIFGPSGSLSTSGNIWLNAGNAITQDAAAAITANTLSIGNTNGSALPGGVSLLGTNMVNTLAAQIDSSTGGLTFKNGKTLTIGSGNYFNGIVATGNTAPINITTTAGNISVHQNITSAGPVSLTSSMGAIAEAGGIINTTGLLTTISSLGTMLNGANTVGSFNATNTANGNIALTNTAANLTLTGISNTAANGDVTLNNTGMITNSAPISASNVSLKAGKMALAGGTINGRNSVSLLSANAIDVAATTTGDALSTLELSNSELNTITAPVLRIGDASSGAIDIKSALALTHISSALNLTSGGAITQQASATIAALPGLSLSGASVTLNQANGAGVISGNATSPGGQFSYTSANPINVTTVDGVSGITTNNGNVSLTANSGDLLIPDQINAGTGTVNLKAISGSVFGTGTSPDIIAGNVLIRAYNNITGSGGLHINAPLISLLGATNGFIDVESFSSNTTLETVSAYDDIMIKASSPLSVNGGITSTIGDIYLSATALNINNLINSSAEVELEADALTWDAAGSGRVVGNLVSIQPYTDGLPITVGAPCIGGPGTCLSVTELWRILSPTIGIGSDLTGDIFVSGITSGVSTITDRNAATTRIGLISNGGITQSTTAINVQDLGIEANGEVILGAANNITNLAAKTLGQSFTFNNGQGFNVVQMSGGTTSAGYYNHEYNIVGINTCSITGSCGDVTLTAAGSILQSSAPITAANLMINSSGDVSLVGSNYVSGMLDISAGGSIYSRTKGVTAINRLNAANGWINVENIGGFILGSTALSPGKTVVNAAGNIMIKAMSPLTVNGAVASSGGSVGLTANNGDTLSINAPISAPNGITLAGGTLSGSYAGSYMQYFNGGTGTSTSTGSTTEALSNTVTDSAEQVIAGVLGTTTPQSGQLLIDELTKSNSSTGESTDSSGKGKNSKQCTK
ncbi:MAG: two-partner secretion domain-containing protein [Methylobacter sp.]